MRERRGSGERIALMRWRALLVACSISLAPNCISPFPDSDSNSGLVLLLLNGNNENNTGALDGWSHRRKINLLNASRAETLVDFPVLISIGGGFDYAKTQSAGQDLRFTSEDGTTLLAYEIENWNSSGTSSVWVKVPSIPGSSDAGFIYAYYGNPSAVDAQQPANVWSAYSAVYHLHDDFNDARGIYNGANSGSVDVPGRIGDGQNFTGAAGITLPANSDIMQNKAGCSISAWVNINVGGSFAYIAQATVNGATVQSRCGLRESSTVNNLDFIGRAGDADTVVNVVTTGAPLSTGVWQHVAVSVSFSGDAVAIYVDGVPQATSGLTSFVQTATDNTTSDATTIGMRGDAGAGFMNAQLDEVRITDAVLSSDWISAQYASMSDSFISVGVEEAL